MIIRIMKFIRGYVKLRLCGYSPERFFNLCSSRGILLWELEHREDAYEFYISIKGFRELKPILKKTKTKLVILERHGLPFFFDRYRKRKMFFGGILLCMALLYGFSLFIWNIHIEGNYTRTTNVLLDFLEDQNVYHGILKNKVDCEELETQMRETFPDIIWTSVEISGTKLIVKVEENETLAFGEEVEKEEAAVQPMDIVAESDMTITSIYTRNGTPMVEKGDQVKKGDVLISGRIDILDDNGEIAAYEYCQSDGDIYGLKTQIYKEQINRTHTIRQDNGTTAREISFRLFGYEICIFRQKIKEGKFDKVTIEKQMKLGENFYLPFSCLMTTSHGYEEIQKKDSKEEVKQKAEENFQEFCEKMMEKGIQIIGNSVKIEVNDTECLAKGTVTLNGKVGVNSPTEVTEVPKEETEENEYIGNGD